MTEHHRTHRSRRHRERQPLKKTETFLTHHFFRVLGIAFFIAGAVYLVRLARPGTSFFQSVLSFFTTAGAEPSVSAISFPFNGWYVFLQLLPGLVLLVLPFLLKQRPGIARVTAFAGTIWVLVVHIKVLSYDFLHTATCYPSMWAAMGVTLMLCVLPLWHAWKMKLASLQVIILLLFYIALLFITNNYQWHYYPDFLYLLFFSGLVLAVGLGSGKLVPVYLQAFLCILLVAIFWIRRIMMRDSADLVATYIIISSLFYATFFISGLVINLSKRHVIYELASALLLLVNTFFYWITVLLVLKKYGHAELSGVFTLLLVLFNGTLLLLSPRFNPGLFRNPYVFVTLFLISMILPLWAQQNYVILSASVFSVLLIYYAKSGKNLSALVLSIGLVALAVLMLFYKWVLFWFPGLYAGAFPDDAGLFYSGFQAGLFTIFALFFNHLEVKKLEMTVGDWFSRRRYRLILKILLIIVVYITGFWCWQYLSSLFFPSTEAMLLFGYYYTCLYLLILVLLLARQRSSLLLPVYAISALILVAYPPLINYSVVAVRDMGLMNGSSSCFIAHFFFLPVIAGLILLLYSGLKKIWEKKRKRIPGLRIFIIALVLPIILLEYDQFTIGLGYNGNAKISDMVMRNHHLPWSVVLLLVSLVLIGVGIVRKHRYIPQISVVLLLAAVAKILVYDFAFLGETGRIAVLFILGGFLIAFSFFYSRFRRMVSEKKTNSPTGKV